MRILQELTFNDHKIPPQVEKFQEDPSHANFEYSLSTEENIPQTDQTLTENPE